MSRKGTCFLKVTNLDISVTRGLYKVAGQDSPTLKKLEHIYQGPLRGG